MVWLAILGGAVVGLSIGDSDLALVGALLGWLIARSAQLQKQVDALQARLQRMETANRPIAAADEQKPEEAAASLHAAGEQIGAGPVDEAVPVAASIAHEAPAGATPWPSVAAPLQAEPTQPASPEPIATAASTPPATPA